MIYTSENPGPWQKWITKPENAKLNIQEARSKYLKEQLLFEQQYQNYMINQASTLNWDGQFGQGGPSSNTIMSNSGFSAGALATIMAAAIYETTNDTVAWAVTASVMAVLLVFGWVLTKPPDGKPIKPDVTFDLKRRLFE